MSCVVVVGTGRSGTSLAMQALGEVGVSTPEDEIKASENNLRGTGESKLLRDRIVELDRELASVAAFRPNDWRTRDCTTSTVEWLTEYITERSTQAGAAGFAEKFPLSAMYLPVWVEAAEKAGVSVRFLWATRDAENTMHSHMRAYGSSAKRAATVWVRRMFYLLRDLPDDTVVLPYEGWQTEEDAQLRLIASVSEANRSDSRNSGEPLFYRVLDSSDTSRCRMARGLPSAVVEVVNVYGEVISERGGILSQIVNRNGVLCLRLAARLSEAMRALQPDKAAASEDELDTHIRFLDALSEDPKKNESEMKAEIEVLKERIREVIERNRELETRKAPESLPKSGVVSDAAAAKADDLERKLEQQRSHHAEELEAVKDEADAAERRARETAESRIAEVQKLASSAESRARIAEASEQRAKEAYSRLTAAYDALEEDIEARTRQRLAAAEAKVARHQSNSKASNKKGNKHNAELRKELKKMESSTSWRVTAPMRAVSRVVRGKKARKRSK